MSPNRRPARIGRLVLENNYENPVVDVQHEFRTADHEIYTTETRESNYAVQVMGRRPARINIEGYVREDHTDSGSDIDWERPFRRTSGENPDDLRAPLYVFSERWTGTAVPKQSNVTQQRQRVDGYKLYRITAELREVVENIKQDNAIAPLAPYPV